MHRAKKCEFLFHDVFGYKVYMVKCLMLFHYAPFWPGMIEKQAKHKKRVFSSIVNFLHIRLPLSNLTDFLLPHGI
jgi:hypothetical protein